MNRLVNKWLKIVQHLPRYCLPLSCHCVLCLQPSERDIALCFACERQLPWLKNPCTRCGISVAPPFTVCPQCMHQPPPFERLSSLFDYAWPLDRFIAKLKYGAHLPFGKMLGTLLATHLEVPQRVDCLLGMPLHPHRQQERGFNQSFEIAQEIAKRTQLPFDRRSCTKVIDTPSQAALTANQRAHNLSQHAFAISKDFSAKHVLVIDDVVTTMATISAFSRALKHHGVSTVEIWSVCRTKLC